MKIIVTGGAGFIGSHLCDRLLEDGHEVVAVDNFLTGHKANIAHLAASPHFSLLEHDVIKPLPATPQADAIFHLASPASPNHHSKKSYHALPMETMLVNSRGTLGLLKRSQEWGAKFLFASTSEVYGDPLEHPQKETYNGNVSPTGPRSVYDESKRFGETLTAYFVRSQGVDARIARIFNTYGPRMHSEDKRMIVSFITQALADKPMSVFGEGTQTRSLCYVSDLVEGLVRLMFTLGTSGTIVNLGAAEEKTVEEFAQIIRKTIQSKSKIIFSEALPQDDPRRRMPDISLAKKLLKWEPQVSLEHGLAHTIEYFKKVL